MKTEKSLIEKFSAGIAPAIDIGAEALGIIPGFGPLLGVIQTLQDIQSQILLNKIRAFLDGTSSATEEDLKAAATSFDTPGKREELAGSLILAINGYTDFYKCELLGKLYLAFLRKKISSVELRRLGLAISTAFPDDIQEFLIDKCADSSPSPYKENLQRIGFIGEITGDKALAWGGVLYELTPLGQTLLRVAC